MGKHTEISEQERARLTEVRDRLRRTHLTGGDDRRPTPTRGVHHVALISSDVEATIDFYQGLLGFPLTKIFENRDLAGSTHFFFDIGHGNALAFFDLPGVDAGPYAEVLGGLHHLAISIEPERWQAARAALTEAGVDFDVVSEVSMYFQDPDGARLELIADPLGEMYGESVN